MDHLLDDEHLEYRYEYNNIRNYNVKKKISFDLYIKNTLYNCDICYEIKKQNEKKILPCNHNLCFDCFIRINNNKCPFCRQIIYKEKHIDYFEDDIRYHYVNYIDTIFTIPDLIRFFLGIITFIISIFLYLIFTLLISLITIFTITYFSIQFILEKTLDKLLIIIYH